MHAIAGTIGHDLITDEYARQQAKQASRTRAFGADIVAALTGGTSTPSTAASPPHDAEADREAKRLEAAKHLEFLRTVRAWADGDPVTLIEKARIESVAENLDHLARQVKADQDACVRTGLPTTASVRLGQAAAYREAALLVRDLLR